MAPCSGWGTSGAFRAFATSAKGGSSSWRSTTRAQGGGGRRCAGRARSTTAREIYLVPSVETPFTVRVEPAGAEVPMGDTVPVRAWVERDGAVVRGTSFACELLRQEQKVAAVTLLDDGAHGDGPAG